MSASLAAAPGGAAGLGLIEGACATCVRRAWLLDALGGPLDCCAHDRERLGALLALEDAELIAALAGRRRAELRAAHERFVPPPAATRAGTHTLCRHRVGYPRALADAGAPWMLSVAGSANRLAEMLARPVVCLTGSTRPSDYGREVARSLARGLAASGVSVLGGWREGIDAAAHAGALESRGPAALAVLGCGLAASTPLRRRPLLARVASNGCALSELADRSSGRRWGAFAAERTIARLATVTVVIEARESPGDLATAALARSLGGIVAAVPGRVSSPLSQGTHALLMSGARLVRGPEDVLELAYPLTPEATPLAAPALGAGIEPRLRALLERVGAGCDTQAELCAGAAEHDADEVLAALSELELMGLLTRGDGGRYLPCGPPPASARER